MWATGLAARPGRRVTAAQQARRLIADNPCAVCGPWRGRRDILEGGPAPSARLSRHPRPEVRLEHAPCDPSSARPRVNLALQGGGAHGAFTWGVLDRLLEDGRIEVAGSMRHQCRGHERGGTGLRHGPRRPGRGTRHACPLLGGAGRAGPLQPAAADPARPGAVHWRHGLLAGLALLGRAVAHGLALCSQPDQLQPAGRSAGRRDRLRLAAREPHHTVVRLRYQRQDRQDPRIRLPRDLGQGHSGVGVPAVPLQGGRDRRRVLLGWRLHGQSRRSTR